MTRVIYFFWKIGWYIDHGKKAFKGMVPPCYKEWLDFEWLYIKNYGGIK